MTCFHSIYRQLSLILLGCRTLRAALSERKHSLMCGGMHDSSIRTIGRQRRTHVWAGSDTRMIFSIL
uniref:Putative secreted protein n=1 Tax=Ixodes ricinus TaxID=34613 RepID=A0A6B0U122_IXORI